MKLFATILVALVFAFQYVGCAGIDSMGDLAAESDDPGAIEASPSGLPWEDQALVGAGLEIIEANRDVLRGTFTRGEDFIVIEAAFAGVSEDDEPGFDLRFLDSTGAAFMVRIFGDRFANPSWHEDLESQATLWEEDGPGIDEEARLRAFELTDELGAVLLEVTEESFQLPTTPWEAAAWFTMHRFEERHLSDEQAGEAAGDDWDDIQDGDVAYKASCTYKLKFSLFRYIKVGGIVEHSATSLYGFSSRNLMLYYEDHCNHAPHCPGDPSTPRIDYRYFYNRCSPLPPMIAVECDTPYGVMALGSPSHNCHDDAFLQFITVRNKVNDPDWLDSGSCDDGLDVYAGTPLHRFGGRLLDTEQSFFDHPTHFPQPPTMD